jgi:protein-L-isoaspartate(D-aspartate) O-methyltransferase
LTSKDYQHERGMMVRRQLIPRGIEDVQVVEAMGKVPRHLFVDEHLQDAAYNDSPLPIGEGQTISQPYMVALMTEALELMGHEKTLEVGTGSGYQTAILAELSNEVYSVERMAELLPKVKKS